jgi:hypothetical protein
LDNGSTDSTVQLIRELEKASGRVTFAGHTAERFEESLRGLVFNQYRSVASKSDWWCRLDADEIYIDDPLEFLRSVPRTHHVVYSASFQFYFTDRDAVAWQRDPNTTKSESVEDRMRYFLCNHSEARFFRHRNRLTWEKGAFPRHVGIVHPNRIRLKHYQYRSPAQIETRLRVRQETVRRGSRYFDYDNQARSWKDKIVSAAQLRQVSGSMEDFNYDPALLAPILESPVQRLAKQLLHGLNIWP